MTTPTGTISFSQISAEFGTPPGKNVGAYRVNQSIAGRRWSLDAGVPSSGAISFSQLRGKTLNIVVDYAGGTEYGVDSETRYNSSGVVVGGFRSRPTSSSTTTKKVHHVIRKKIGGTVSIASISPTAPVAGNVFSFLFGIRPNTLGTFLSTRPIPQSEWATRNVGWRVYYIPPTTGVKSVTTTTSPNLSLSGGSGSGAVIRLTKTQRISVRKVRTIFYEDTEISYVPTLISGGDRYSKNNTVTTSWDSRTFTFNVTNTTPVLPSFKTGSGWGGLVQLNYYIESGAAIGGKGGDGGNGGANSNPAQNGGNGGTAFGISVGCNIYVIGSIRQGAGGGGGGSFVYQDIGRGCGQRYNGDGGGGGAGLPGGKGGSQQNFAPGAYDSGCAGEYRWAYDGGDGTELTGGLANTGNMLRAANRAGNGGSLIPYSPTGQGGAGGTSGGSPGFAFIVAPGGSYNLILQGGSVIGGTTYGSF